MVTGANSGLGLETARELARRGAKVTMAVRSLDRGRQAIDDIKASISDRHGGDAVAPDLSLRQLDLASLDSIAEAGAELAKRLPHIDLLINNAGVMYTPMQRTADGFEMQFGTNHLGHFAWTGQLIDKLAHVDGARVVTISSLGHRVRSRIDFDDLNAERGYDRVAAYGRSKLANLLFTYELQRRLESAGAKAVALAAHPGFSDSELSRHLPGAERIRPLLRLITQDTEMGALPALRAATDLSADGGQFYGPGGFGQITGHPKLVTSSARSHEVETQQRLWAASEQLTGVSFPIPDRDRTVR